MVSYLERYGELPGMVCNTTWNGLVSVVMVAAEEEEPLRCSVPSNVLHVVIGSCSSLLRLL